MYHKPKESDWKHFRRQLEAWRERYLERKNQEIVALLTASDKTPTEQFWSTKRRMEKEAKILVDCLDGFSRSKMLMKLLLMYKYGMIHDSDLEAFSEELQERIRKYVEE